jgi:hypothetical protein
MDLGLFEKSPHIASLIVRLYDSHRLYGLARDNQPEARMELSGVMTNLLEHGLTEREQELVADVLIALVRQAETDLRVVLAERLSKMERVPLRLILHLVNDEIKIASPILEHSPVLSDLDLIYIVKSQGPAYWQAIAKRENLSDPIIDVLAGTKEAGTALALTSNERVKLTSYAMEVLSGLAEVSPELAKPLLMREEMPPTLARRLYTHVGRELKDYIKAFYGGIPADVEKATDEIILDFVDAHVEKAQYSPSEREFMPGEDMLALARRSQETGQLNMTGMMDALKKGYIRNFIAMFSVYTGISARQIHGVLKQAGGRKLAILCRAYSMQKGDFSTIYLLTHKMRSSERLVNHNDLLSALMYFDRVRPESARLVLARRKDLH